MSLSKNLKYNPIAKTPPTKNTYNYEPNEYGCSSWALDEIFK